MQQAEDEGPSNKNKSDISYPKKGGPLNIPIHSRALLEDIHGWLATL